jgi:hypothetical protein
VPPVSGSSAATGAAAAGAGALAVSSAEAGREPTGACAWSEVAGLRRAVGVASSPPAEARRGGARFVPDARTPASRATLRSDARAAATDDAFGSAGDPAGEGVSIASSPTRPAAAPTTTPSAMSRRRVRERRIAAAIADGPVAAVSIARPTTLLAAQVTRVTIPPSSREA